MAVKARVSVAGAKAGSAACVAIQEALPRVLGKALREPMVDRVLPDAKALVPRRTGELYDALDVSAVRQYGKTMTDRLAAVGLRIKPVPSAKVSTGGGASGLRPRSYWHLVEFGTAHSPAHPFIRPAFDKNAKHLVEDFGRIAAEGIDRANKLAQRRMRGQYRGGEDE